MARAADLPMSYSRSTFPADFAAGRARPPGSKSNSPVPAFPGTEPPRKAANLLQVHAKIEAQRRSVVSPLHSLDAGARQLTAPVALGVSGGAPSGHARVGGLTLLVRDRPGRDGTHGHVIDYRHLIHAVRRKQPVALLNLEISCSRRTLTSTCSIINAHGFPSAPAAN
jgi:hypothetical protein